MVKRPIINTRDEPHADREKYRRFHIIIGDSNLCEVSTYLRVGVTSIVLALVEDGAIPKSLSITDPVKVVKEISHDLGCKRQYALERGGRMTAIEVQKELLDNALRYFSSRSLDPITKDVLVRWERVLARARRRSDAARARGRLGREAQADPQLHPAAQGRLAPPAGAHCSICSNHDVRPDKGLFFLLERRGEVDRVVESEEIERAVTTPPSDTRAYFRGECIRRYPEAVFGVNWDSISFNVGEEPIKRILMNEPLKGTRAHVEDLLNASPPRRFWSAT